MGKEIERKFKVANNEFKNLAKGILYRQGYIGCNPGKTVRIRIADNKGYITVKGPSKGFSRSEFEYEIPLEDANSIMSELCEKPIIEKYRYKIDFKGFIWEVDEFLGDNEGLIIAEIELKDESEGFDIPRWIGEEVTGDSRYFNSNLMRNPFNTW